MRRRMRRRRRREKTGKKGIKSKQWVGSKGLLCQAQAKQGEARQGPRHSRLDHVVIALRMIPRRLSNGHVGYVTRHCGGVLTSRS